MSIRNVSRFFVKNFFLKKYIRQLSTGNECRNSSYQRTRISPMDQPKMRDLKDNFLQETSNGQMSNEKWLAVRKNIMKTYKNLNTSNIDATVLGLLTEAEHLKLAKAYIAFLNSTRGLRPNTATLGKLLRIYNATYLEKGQLTQTEEDEVLEICDCMRSGKDILDAITCEYLIHGLVTTKSRWKESLSLLEMLKLTAQPTSSVYSQLIIKAFSTNELELGWYLLEEMVSSKKQPKCEVYLRILDAISTKKETFMESFQKLLSFLEKHELLLTEKVANSIKILAEGQKYAFKASSTHLNRIGKCTNCGTHMRKICISEEEYIKLRDSFLQKVLIRADVFQKSTPEEVSQFKQFVEQTAPYDCVIDGLNVAYSKGAKRSPKDLARLLASVVRHFDMKRQNVLVLGRKHMNNWPKDVMKYIRQHANVFFTNNLTHDDPFLLYATLKSGQMTDFFSRDLMRSHAYLLGEDLRPIFRRWQQEHQYSLITQTVSGKTLIKEPTRHLLHAHRVDNVWHVPLTPEYVHHQPEIFEVPESWLCIQIENV